MSTAIAYPLVQRLHTLSFPRLVHLFAVNSRLRLSSMKRPRFDQQSRSEESLIVRNIALPGNLSLPRTSALQSAHFISNVEKQDKNGDARSRKPYLLFYDYVDDILEKRKPFRSEHLALTDTWVSEGKLLLGGPLSEPVDGACLSFLAESENEIESNFVLMDPYFKNGLVKSHRIRPWTVLVGSYLSQLEKDCEINPANEELPSVNPDSSPVSGMTGFARVDSSFEKYNFSWECRSLNGRSLDVRFRIPDAYMALQQGATSAVSERFSRGSISITLSVQVDKSQAREGRLTVNEEELTKLGAQLKEIQSRSEALSSFQCPSLDSILRLPGIVEWKEDSQDEAKEEQMLNTLSQSLLTALDQLQSSRKSEGAKLASILTILLDQVKALTEEAVTAAADRSNAIKEKLTQQVNALLEQDKRADQMRLDQEIAILVTKVDVTEELERLRIHVESGTKILSGKGDPVEHKTGKGKVDLVSNNKTSPVGRSLEFITQELSREANTLCSKANDISLTQIGLKMKGVIEQIREQAANVE